MTSFIKPAVPSRGDAGQETPDGWRSAGPSYQELLDNDSVQPIRASLRLESPSSVPGVMHVPVERYLSQEIHFQEVEKIWKKVWQIACREEDIPNIGDYIVYDIADLSWIVVKTGEGEYKAHRNACLHRGRKLKEGQGRNAKEFRCYFHGWSWEINGEIKNVTCAWDFPGMTPKSAKLPEAKTAVWQGWVFINMDPDCAPLENFLGTLSDHFTGVHDQSRKYKRAHTIKMVRCNWKVTQETFMESYHAAITHPHMAASTGDANAQYDEFGTFARAMNASGVQSPHITNRQLTQQELLDDITNHQALDKSRPFLLPDGVTARVFSAMAQREDLRPVLGDEVDRLHDADFDSHYFTLFPNFHPWSGFTRINYRFRPYGNDPDMSIMEVFMLEPYDDSKPRPAPARAQILGPDDPIIEATDLGGLARIFQQDEANMPKMQLGIKAMYAHDAKATLQFSNYAETKIKHFHKMWAEWMALED